MKAGAINKGSGPSGSRSPANKRTFKDKFHNMLQEAQEANIKAVHRQELQDRKSLSVAMLVQGRPQAFVDFFMLSQPHFGSAAAAEHSEDADQGNSQNTLTLQTLILLQEQLIRADAGSRSGQHEEAFDAHRQMARHFTQLGMLDKSVFFWKKCLQASGCYVLDIGAPWLALA